MLGMHGMRTRFIFFGGSGGTSLAVWRVPRVRVVGGTAVSVAVSVARSHRPPALGLRLAPHHQGRRRRNRPSTQHHPRFFLARQFAKQTKANKSHRSSHSHSPSPLPSYSPLLSLPFTSPTIIRSQVPKLLSHTSSHHPPWLPTVPTA
jgi:hypothetical protein